MLNLRPDMVRSARRLAVVLTAFFFAASAIAAPDLAGANAAPAVQSTDAVMRLLAEKGLIPSPSTPSTPAAPSTLAMPPAATATTTAGESPFVDRMRDKASEMVLTAMNFLGVPYRRGGNNADHGFDCSGFTRHVFEMSLGLMLPRRADEQATTAGLLSIKRDELKPGDLVFFNTMRRTFSHVGIYVGEGKFIHSPKPGGEVRVDDMRAAYWNKRFTGGRRAETSTAVTNPSSIETIAPLARTLN